MNRADIVNALKSANFQKIYQKADAVRKREKGDVVFIRAIIEFSSYCVMPCKYCGLNRENPNAVRYRMSFEDMVEVVDDAIAAGYKTIVLQGGEDPVFADGTILEKVIRYIKGVDKDVAVTLSAGELRRDVLFRLKNAGADRFLLRHETSDENLYEALHPGHNFQERAKVLQDLKELGYEAGSGFMVGIPGQSIESLADDLLFLEKIHCHMAGIGPYISHPDTELGGSENGSPEMTKRCVAIARLLLPKANLPVTTAVGVLDDEEIKRTFDCGANVIMRKVNPQKYKDAYEIYPAASSETDIAKERMELEEMIRSIGRIPL